jgi:exopolyphosphatase/guanosine-5'-triphosphate,3'-diphosphate pyrophosphatase
MKPHRLAVIDLGSNTFHLLIIQIFSDGAWTTLVKDRRYVKLAAGGLRMIDDASMNRAALVMQEFADQIDFFGVARTVAIGTSALREAQNQSDALALIRDNSGIPVRIIDGHTEAIYIWKGIRSAMPPLHRHGLIMDIGGGSVEFILFHDQQVIFTGSYTIGVAVLHSQFHLSEPISKADIADLERHIGLEMQSLFTELKTVEAYDLIGASGSFEVIQEVLLKIRSGDHWSELEILNLTGYMEEVIALDYEGRRSRPEIPEERLDYIVVAYLLIRFLVRQYPPKGLYFSDYALKEGVIAEHIELFLD